MDHGILGMGERPTATAWTDSPPSGVGLPPPGFGGQLDRPGLIASAESTGVKKRLLILAAVTALVLAPLPADAVAAGTVAPADLVRIVSGR